MTTTFTLTGRLLDDSKQPLKNRTLSLHAYPELTSDEVADETYPSTPSVITDDDGYLCLRVGSGPADTPGVPLLAGPGRQYSIKTSSGPLRHPLRFDAPTSGTLDLSSIVPAAPTPPATWETWSQAIGVRLDDLEQASTDSASALSAEALSRSQADDALTTALGTKANASALGAETTRATNAETALRTGTDTTFETRLSNAYVGRLEAATYTYNADGTVATETAGGFTTTYAYNSDGTVHTATRNGVTFTYTYDASGNVTAVA